MKKFAVISDPHIGNWAKWGGPVRPDGLNSRGELCVETLERAVAKAIAMKCEVFYVAGDLFQSRRPEPAIIAAVQRVFAGASPAMEVVIVPGNHDMLDASAEDGNTACEPLWSVAKVVGMPEVRSGVYCIPYDSRMPMADHIENCLERLSKNSGITDVVAHVGVFDEEDAAASPWYRKAKDGMDAGRLFVAMEKAGVKRAFVGNYHQHRWWNHGAPNHVIVQVGTLCPASFGDGGIESRGLMAVFDDGRIDMVEIHGPRFVVMDSAGKDEKFGGDARNTYFVRQTGGEEQDASKSSLLGGYEYLPTRRLAEPGQSAGYVALASPEQALASFVADMKLPEGVSRAAVDALVRDCWKKGA